MKYLILFVLAFFTAVTAFSSPRLDSSEVFTSIGYQRNFVPNTSANFTANLWTASSATVARDTSAGYQFEGVASFAVTSATNVATIRTSDMATVDPYTSNSGNCQASWWYKDDASKWQVELRDSGGTNVLVTQPLSNATNWTYNYIIYPCATNYRIYFTSNAASPANFHFAGVQWGPASALGQVSQASLVGSADFLGATSCQWTGAGATSDTPAVTACNVPTVTGSIAALGTKKPGFTLQNAIAGRTYFINVNGPLRAANVNGAIRLFDGTTATNGSYFGNNSSTATIWNPTLMQFAYTPATTGNKDLVVQMVSGALIDNSSAAQDLRFDVFTFPSNAQTVAANNLDSLGQVIYTASSTCPAGSIAADGSAISRVTYAPLFNRIGTTFGTGDGSTTFNVPDLRGVFARGAGTSGKLTNANGAAFSGTLGTYQNDALQGHRHNFLANMWEDTNLTAKYSAGSSGYKAATVTGDPAADGSNGTPRTSTETRPANLSLTPCISNATQAAPAFIGSVTSNSLNPERIERATVTAGASCTLATDVVQSGSWVSSCTRNAAGNFTLGITSGMFSASPTCTVTVIRNLANTRYTVSAWVLSVSSSSLNMVWGYNDDQGASIPAAIANVDDSGTFQVMCMGPR